jgi:hypothetical protein
VEIVISGVNNTVLLPKGESAEIVESGFDNKIEYY